MTQAKQAKLFQGSTKTAVVRYQVREIDRSLAFYTQLGFELVQPPAPVIAIIARGDLHLILSGPGASGSRPLANGQEQRPGGSNRIVLYVESLDATIESLRAADARFVNRVEEGPGGKQIQVEDPDGNPIELHEAPKN
jgi:catechol 2,3-dioxygenase-like lactoylglutathione lyase family enzyme